MHACWWRFTHLMKGNETVSYEKYLELVNQGKGMVEIMAVDESGKSTRRLPQLLQFDPRMGVSIVLADNRNLTLDMGMDAYAHLGVSAKYGLLTAFTFPNNSIQGVYSSYPKPIADTVYFNDTYTSLLSLVGKIPNACLSGKGKPCLVKSPPEFWDAVRTVTDQQWDDLEKGKIAPLAVFSP